MADECRKCAAPLRWGRTAKLRRIPLNYEPDPDGNVVLDEFGNATVLGKNDNRPVGVALYMPHHATCPYSHEFRRPR